MTIQPIGDQSALLFCTPADLSLHGFSSAALTSDQALALLREACRPSGLPVSVRELEIYPDGLGVLIFAALEPAHPSRPRQSRLPGRRRLGRRPT